MWETLAQAVINGLLIGGIYALVSIGVTLIFGVVKIVNFAQGEFVMIGMYISFFLANQFGIDPIVSLDLVLDEPRTWTPSIGISNSFGFGGHNGTIVMGPARA